MTTYKYNGIVSTIQNIIPDIKEAKLYVGDGDEEGTRIIDNIKGDWGDIFPFTIAKSDSQPLPTRFKIRWFTISDLKCYELTADIDSVRMEKMWVEQEKLYPMSPFKFIVVGIAPYGEITLWLRSEDNAVIFQQYKAEEVEYTEREKSVYSKLEADEEFIKSIITKEQYDGMMKQYTYRYVPLEEYFNGKRWMPYANDDVLYENIEIECVEDKRVDGTFDFTDCDCLYKYHTAGMPKRITVRWSEGEAKYFAHFWLCANYVTWFFESFHNRFPQTPADLLIRLDTRANRYEVAMTAEDLIPRAFIGTEYIVFRNDEEISRSKFFYRKEREWDW